MAKDKIDEPQTDVVEVDEIEEELEAPDPNDVFDDAFSNFSKGDADEEAEVDEEEPPVEEPTEAEEVPAEAAEAEEEPEPKADEKPARLTDDELIDRLSSAVADKAKPKEEPKAEPKAEEAPLLNADEQTLVDEYQKDWPDVAKAESLIRKTEYQQIVKFVFEQVAAELQPLMQQVGTLAQTTHYSQLQETIGDDYDDVREGVVSWVETQPEYLQNAYKHVIQNGTVDEVADLVNRYRLETGVAPQPQPSAKKETELPPAAKKAVQSLAPVSSKRSAVPAQEDAGDFESAFSKYAGKFSINA